MPMDTRPIGVFDSGLGGVSTLRSLVHVMPGEDFIYLGDTANAPYGTKKEEEIRDLTFRAVKCLIDRGVKELVVACNTATSAAAGFLRSTLDIPVIGIEPAVKPAAEIVGDGCLLVLATPATIRQEKLKKLVERYGRNTRLLPCPGLMEYAERLELEGPSIDAFLDRLLLPVRELKIDACVLGCTHYPFLKKAIEKALPGVPIFDGNEGTARQARRVLEERGLLSGKGEGGKVEFISTAGGTEKMEYLFRVPEGEGNGRCV